MQTDCQTKMDWIMIYTVWKLHWNRKKIRFVSTTVTVEEFFWVSYTNLINVRCEAVVARSAGYRDIAHLLITVIEYPGDRLDGLSTEKHRFHHPHTVKNTRYA